MVKQIKNVNGNDKGWNYTTNIICINFLLTYSDTG